MRARSIMTYRTTIQRRGTNSDTGGGFEEVWTTTTSDVPCYAWYVSGQENVTSERPEVIDIRVVLIPRGIDVKEGDRLISVVDRKGSVYFDGPLMIDGVGEKPDHLRLTTRRIS